MRVTTLQYTETFKNQINTQQGRQYDLQNKISSGLAFTKASDDPGAFATLKVQQSGLEAAQQYLNSTATASQQATSNQQAMSDLQTTLSRINEIGVRANSSYGSTGIIAVGQEMDSLMDQVVSIANRTDTNGNFLFGGTANVQPVTPSQTAVTLADGTTATVNTSAYNTNAVATQQAIQIAPNASAVTVGLAAGVVDTSVAGYPTNGGPASLYTATPTNGSTSLFDSTATVTVSGSTTFSGFLVKAGTSGVNGTGVDVLGYIQDAVKTTLNGQPLTDDQRQNLLRALNYVGEQVGKSSAQLSQFDLNQQSLTSVTQNLKLNISSISSADTAGLATDLATANTAYQGALSSGAKLLNMSLLDYLQ